MSSHRLFNHVLLLEDDPAHAVLIERALREYSDTVVRTENVKDALLNLEDKKTDLIISDLHLPDAHDSSFIEQLVKRSPQTPIIVLTSSTSLETAVDAMKRGAKDYIVKSFDQNFRDAFSVALQRTATNIQLERERKRLINEMAVLRIAIENSNEGLAIINNSGAIIYSNAAFQDFIALWGGTLDSIETLMSEDKVNKAATVIDHLKKRIENDDDSIWSTEISLKENKTLGFQLSVTLLTNALSTEQSYPRGVIWIRDISEIKSREKFQREILSTTTHDLKGPLGAIMLSTELLSRAPGNEARVKELTLRINASTQTALNLIDEMLSARRIQEGNYILKPTPHLISELLEETYQTYAGMANAKGITLEVKNSTDHKTAQFDRLAVLRVLSNLVSNSIKFTPRDGHIVLSATIDQDEFSLTVQDSGSGMEAQEVKRLFERYTRLNKHNDISGTGLGLFVVKCLVTAHGGRIDVESRVGVGTTFRVTLPLHPPTNANGELLALDFTR